MNSIYYLSKKEGKQYFGSDLVISLSFVPQKATAVISIL